jgi:uncharacterized membrane-anchored protein
MADMNIRRHMLWVVAVLVIATVNVLVYQSEQLAAHGRPVFLALAPVDPRSLLQGDYMRLNYALSREVETDGIPPVGLIAVQLDQQGVAQHGRLYNPQTPLAEHEVVLRYHKRDLSVSIGPESFFFQEGHARYYESARYAEIRVSSSGDMLLTGLRGPNLEVLGPP